MALEYKKAIYLFHTNESNGRFGVKKINKYKKIDS